MATVMTAPRSFALWDRANAMVAEWKETRLRRAVYNRTLQELSLLNDRDLADIGISRYDIGAVSLQAAQLR